jgi:hypothetical protein
MAVSIQITPDQGIVAGTPVPLFTPRTGGGVLPGSDKQSYSVARDGRILTIVRPDDDTPTPISVFLNWKPPSGRR